MFGLSAGVHILAALVLMWLLYWLLLIQKRIQALRRLYASGGGLKQVDIAHFTTEMCILLAIPIQDAVRNHKPKWVRADMDLLYRVFFHHRLKCVRIQEDVVRVETFKDLSQEDCLQLEKLGIKVGEL
jgi:hypothetical protein